MPLQALASLEVDISEPVLEISTGFNGDTLTLFGTAKLKGDIVIIVKGPAQETTIRRKSDILGLWITSKSLTFKNVPQYYNVASSRTVFDITDTDTRLKHKMGINSLTFDNIESNITDEQHDRFQEALIQNMQLSGLYSLTPDAIEYLNETLFKTQIYMPANVPIGDYEIEAFLFKNGKLLDKKVKPFEVKQIGTAASVREFALSAPLTYGILIIIIAIFSSLVAILLLRRE